jgi:hypothetical protein
LVLAIVGETLRDNKHFWGHEKNYFSIQNSQDFAEAAVPFFINLISSLIDAGAAVNPTVDLSCPTIQKRDGNKRPYMNNTLASIMQDGHSPLIVASKYRNKELVDIFL